MLDIAVKPPTGQASGNIKIAQDSAQRASQQLSMGMRILDIEDEGSFAIDINDKETRRLLDLLDRAGRKVNKYLLCTQRQ